MSSKNKVYTSLSQDESDRMQKYLTEISKIYGIRLAEIGEFLGKKLKDHVKGEHQWFIAFQIIDQNFDDMTARILTALEAIGAIKGKWSTKDHAINPSSPESESKYGARRRLFKSIIRETQVLIKEELPLPKQDKEGKLY